MVKKKVGRKSIKKYEKNNSGIKKIGVKINKNQ
jgi:hypothetical protein